MYKHILVPLEGTTTDRVIIDHIKELAQQMHSSVVLLHVASGAPARYHGANADTEEVDRGRKYLDAVRSEFVSLGVATESQLAYGDPAKEIVSWVKEHGCDLVAMSTHGHQFVADLVLGTTAIKVQHQVSVPVMLLRAK